MLDADRRLRSGYRLNHSRTKETAFIGGTAFLVAIVYYLAARVGLLLRLESVTPSVLWPPNPILTAVLLLASPRRWGIYLLAALPAHIAVELPAHWPVPLVLALFLTNCSEALIAATLVRGLSGGRATFDTLRGIAVFIVGAGFVAPFLSSFPDSAAMAIFRGDSYWLDWRTRFFANVLGELTLVPPLVMMVSGGVASVRKATPAQILEQSWFWIGLLTLGFVVFREPAGESAVFGILFRVPPFFLFPCLVWAAVRLGPAGTSLTLLVVEMLAIWAGAKVPSPFRSAPPLVNVLYLQMFLIVSAVPLMVLAALIEERRANETLKSAILTSLTGNIAVFNRSGRTIALTERWGRADKSSEKDSRIATNSGESYAGVCRRVLAPDSPYVDKVCDGVQDVINGSSQGFSFQYPSGSPPNERWFMISAVPLQSSTGGAVLTHTEVTEQKQMEIEAKRIRDELTQFSRLTTMGAFAATLAHEVNQPLGAVQGNAEAGRLLLERNEVDKAEFEMILQDIVDDAQRASDVIRRVTRLLRRDDSELRLLDIAEVANEVLDLAQSELITRNVTVVRRLGAGLPTVRGDRIQVQQVLLNLILNGCDAMAGTPEAQRQLTVTIEPGSDGTVHVSVGDTGTGISSAVQDKLFEPFVTTKEQGIGLGLSICRWIITAHGGRLWGENDRDCGATFHFTLPVATLRVVEDNTVTHHSTAGWWGEKDERTGA